jgi:hypothetical protein
MGNSWRGRPEGGNWEPEPRSLLGGILVGAVLFGAVLLLVAFASGRGGNDRAPDAVQPGAALGDSPGATSQPSSQSSSPSPTSTRLRRCAAAADVVERPLRRAGPALDQWEVHVGAMNKLVVGAITLPQATAFWNQTRVGAYHRIDRFKNAEAVLERQGVDCPTPTLLGSAASPALRSCSQHVAAELRALDSARTAITTWNRHMHAMDQLRSGKLSPAAATQMWLTMWQRGVREVGEFRVAAGAVPYIGACDGTGGTPPPSTSPTAEPAPGPPSSTPPASPGSSSESPMPGMDMG